MACGLRSPIRSRRRLSCAISLWLWVVAIFVSDWTRVHANFFQSIELTKGLMFVILLMVLPWRPSTSSPRSVMIVKEKQTDIALLRTLGASPGEILKAFAVQGVLIGLAGTLAGSALGIVLAFNVEAIVHGLEAIFGIQFLDAKVYFMSDLPAHVEWLDVLRVAGVAFVLCALATLYPAWQAARNSTGGGHYDMTDQAVLLARGLGRDFNEGGSTLTVLDGLDLSIAKRRMHRHRGCVGLG